MSDIKEKVQSFDNGFIKSQYEVVDAILKYQADLNANDFKHATILAILDGALVNVFYRLKGIINTIKELTGEEIVVPEKYHKLYKSAREMVYFKGEDLMMVISGAPSVEELPVGVIVEKLKTRDNGKQGINTTKETGS